MIEERIVISDANVIIDLLSVQLLEAFFALPCEICTTDLVISEIERPEQQQIIQKFIKLKKLGVATFEFDEFSEILLLQSTSKNNTSIADCSVWYYAKKVDGRLLTGDGKLRAAAEKDNVKVSGVLYLFDNFVEYGLLSPLEAAENLESLMTVNMRLPKAECESRIAKWRKGL
jgi:predicted nucleic acid-binding protein